MQILGEENYENQQEYGEEIFRELMDFEEGGVEINDIHHDIKLIFKSDWKVSACIEGFTNYFVLIADFCPQ